MCGFWLKHWKESVRVPSLVKTVDPEMYKVLHHVSSSGPMLDTILVWSSVQYGQISEIEVADPES